AGDPKRARQAMQSVDELLVDREDGLIKLFTPPFDKSDLEPGYIKGYPPGIRENGGQYTHAAIWAVWAYATMEHSSQAAELFQMLNPIYHSNSLEKAERYQVEPYVVAADIYSVEPHIGNGGWTWYTGSGGWLYRLGLERILGFNRHADRLEIDPRVPESWSGYTIQYRYGASRYRIRVDNPEGVRQGVKEIRLDGKKQSNTVIELLDDGEDHQVVIQLG
ncbi:MAG: GH36-type glycosyl hydrolase domain-containing protein, partial [Anaerolineales bacterium]